MDKHRSVTYFNTVRIRAAVVAAGSHFLLSVLLALLVGAFVFGIWYPSPFDELSGGRELFWLILGVDVICGPLLTLVVFDPGKARRGLVRDLATIGALQMAALFYGVWTVHEARPLYLVHEVDRFRVVGAPDYAGFDVKNDLASLDDSLKVHLWRGPITVGVRRAADPTEHSRVLFEALSGGRDLAQRPNFYIPYDAAYASQAMQRARPLVRFVERFPAARERVEQALKSSGVVVADALFLPVVHRQEWIALLDRQGRILGFVPGDGFAVP